MEMFFSDDDLSDILEELDEITEIEEPISDEELREMEASERRYEEIICKHKLV